MDLQYLIDQVDRVESFDRSSLFIFNIQGTCIYFILQNSMQNVSGIAFSTTTNTYFSCAKKLKV